MSKSARVSAWVSEKATLQVPAPWWRFWQRKEAVVTQHVQKVIDITDSEVIWIVREMRTQSLGFELFMKVFNDGNDIHGFTVTDKHGNWVAQLEHWSLTETDEQQFNVDF